jgi:hypothetical protein
MLLDFYNDTSSDLYKQRITFHPSVKSLYFVLRTYEMVESLSRFFHEFTEIEELTINVLDKKEYCLNVQQLRALLPRLNLMYKLKRFVYKISRPIISLATGHLRMLDCEIEGARRYLVPMGEFILCIR